MYKTKYFYSSNAYILDLENQINEYLDINQKNIQAIIDIKFINTSDAVLIMLVKTPKQQ